MNSTTQRSDRFGALLMLSGAFALVACGAEEPAAEEGGYADGEPVAATEQAVYAGWTAWTSEENPPISCDGGSLVTDVQCSGSYCDNIRAYCQPTTGVLGASYWTSYFSEEGTNYRICDPGYWVTGIACNGSYCDNIALLCSQIVNFAPTSCYWTGEVSEENGGYLWFGTGFSMRGAQCFGSYCDNKRFYVCQH